MYGLRHKHIRIEDQQLNLKIRCPISLESTEEIEHFKRLEPDIALVVAYGKILAKKILNET